jgi:hypothetical protein
MSSGESTQSTQTQQVNSIPQWVTQAGEQNYAFAQQVANQPLQQYQGQMVAGTSPQTQQAWNLAASSGNVGQDQYAGAQAGFLNSIGQTPSNVTAGQLANTNLSPYMNPFTQSVINNTLPLMQQQNALSQNQQGNAANAAGAFGGSRQGVQQGVAQAQGAMNIGQMAAGLNQANFQQAQAGATGDINRTLAAQQGNQQAQQAKINSDILASQGLANLGDSQTRANAANFTMLSQAGAGQQSQAQDQINAQMAKFQQANSYPQQQLATLLSALGMTPHDTMSTGTSNTQTQTPTNWGALALGGLQDLSGFFKPASDEDMKTDVTKVGKDPKTGLMLHAFRYKGDPKSYPKVVGPMAQEVRKKYPGATQRQGGKLTVDPSIMAAAGVRGYEEGTEDVQPADGSVMGGLGKVLGGGHLAKALGGQDSSAPKAPDMPPGWNAPSQGFFVSGFANGIAKVPSSPKVPGALAMGTDSVPALLTPGEAILNQKAATKLGRGTIKQLNAGTPPSSPLVAAGIKSLAPRTLASFMPPKKAFGAATTMPRAGAKALGGLSNTKFRGALA